MMSEYLWEAEPILKSLFDAHKKSSEYFPCHDDDVDNHDEENDDDQSFNVISRRLHCGLSN